MADFGLLPVGFVPKTLADIKAEREASLQAGFGASIPLDESSAWGQLVGIESDRESELWEVAQATYSARDPDKAEGQALDALCAITGTIRQAARSSTANMVCTGVAGTLLTAGHVATVLVTAVRFKTLTDVTIAAATAWAISTLYTAGIYRTNSGNIYFCTVGGTSAGSGGPTGTGTAIVDGTVTWRFVGQGAGFVVAAAASEDTGAFVALTGTLTEIATPETGWNGVNNVADAVPGRDVERDDELRIRREVELPGNSAGVMGAIQKNVKNATAAGGAKNVIVFQNNTSTINVDGMPPNSVEVLVDGGIDQEIADAVYAATGGGIGTSGNQTSSVVDTTNAGQVYTIKWSRPTLKDVYIVVTVTKDSNTFPADGSAQVLAALLAYGNALSNGRDVVARAVGAPVFAIAGVLNVSPVNIGLTISPATETTIAVALRERARFDSSRITINLADGTP